MAASDFTKMEILRAEDLRVIFNGKKTQNKLKRGHDDNAHRLRRAINWLELAEEDSLGEIRFMLYWISFNALYGQGDKTHNGGERELSTINDFISKIIKSDKNRVLEYLNERENNVNKILRLRQVYKKFWDAMYDPTKWKCWESDFIKDKESAEDAYKNKDASTIVKLLFNRLYVVRNQLMHGSASINIQPSQISRNKTQVQNGMILLSEFVPIFIYIILHAGGINLGPIPYPRVGNNADDECEPRKLWAQNEND